MIRREPSEAARVSPRVRAAVQWGRLPCGPTRLMQASGAGDVDWVGERADRAENNLLLAITRHDANVSLGFRITATPRVSPFPFAWMSVLTYSARRGRYEPSLRRRPPLATEAYLWHDDAHRRTSASLKATSLKSTSLKSTSCGPQTEPSGATRRPNDPFLRRRSLYSVRVPLESRFSPFRWLPERFNQSDDQPQNA